MISLLDWKMSEGKYLALVVVSVLLLGLSQVEETHGQTIEPELSLCQPTEYAFGNNTVTFTDSTCIPYDSNTQTPSDVNPSDFFRCTFPSVLTDSNLGPEEMLPDDSNMVYTWEPNTNQVLFTYDGPVKTFSRIVVYYFRNATGVGLPKINFCSASEDAEIWNTTLNEMACGSQDEIRPGNTDLPCDLPPCRENVTIEVTFSTNKVLLTIENSKNYDFVASEVQFFVASVPESTTTMQATNASTGTTPEVQTDPRTTIVNTQQMTTRDGGVCGVKQIKETLFVCVFIAAISIMMSYL